jgi:hypothetical protein
MYIIDGDLLTALADALRAKGEISKTTPLPYIRKTSNAIDLETEATTNYDSSNPDDTHYTERVFINGATSLRVQAYAKMPYHDTSEAGYLKIGETYYRAASSTNQTRKIDVTIPGDAVDIEWLTNFGGKYFYYMQIDGLDENGIPMESLEDTPIGEDGMYTLAEMVAAIDLLRPYTQETLEISRNGKYEVYDYRWCDVKVDNESIPTTYKEVAITSHDGYTFDISKYVVNDNSIFTLGFTLKTAVTGTGVACYNSAMYHHNPIMKNETKNITVSMYENSTADLGAGVTAFPVLSGTAVRAQLTNGVLSFVRTDGDLQPVGTSAVLRYLG